MLKNIFHFEANLFANHVPELHKAYRIYQALCVLPEVSKLAKAAPVFTAYQVLQVRNSIWKLTDFADCLADSLCKLCASVRQKGKSAPTLTPILIKSSSLKFVL
jgi:hypothetical protein